MLPCRFNMYRELGDKFFKVLVLLSICIATDTGRFCPNRCNCEHSQSGIRIKCKTMPEIIPDNTSYAEVQITELHHDQIRFQHHSWKDVKTLLVTNHNYKAGTIITEKSFSGLAALQELHISELRAVERIPPGTFAHLGKLKVLDLSNNERLLLNGLSSVFPDLNNISLNLLNLSRTNIFNRGWKSTHMDEHFVSTFGTLRIKSIDLSWTGNIVYTGSRHILEKYFRFPHLEVFNISHSSISLLLSMSLESSGYASLPPNLMVPVLKQLIAESMKGNFIRTKFIEDCVLNLTNIPFDEFCANVPANRQSRLPPALEYVNIDRALFTSSCAETRPRPGICVNEKNTLKKLSLRYSKITGWNAPVISLNHLNTLDLSHNKLTVITSTSLRYLHNLKQLLLGSNRLWKYQSNVSFETVLNYSTELEEIDLSNNNLSLIPKLIFKRNTKLQKIDFSKNKLKALAIEIEQLIDLRVLDLSQNSLSTITDFCLKDIGLLTSTRNYPFIDLTNNNIMCLCETKKFIKSLSEISGSLINYMSYTCSYKNRIVNIRNIDERTLNKDCILETLIIVVSLLCVALTIVLGAVITYRYRIKLFKLYIMYRFWRYRHKTEGAVDRIFLAYSHYDRDLVLAQFYPELNSRLQRLLGTENNVLYINDRDFALPGLIDEEIVNAVLLCKCTVALVSRRFLESNWAHLEVSYSWMKKRPIALVFLEDIKENELHGIMRYLYNKKVRLLWPRLRPDENCEDFWINLIQGLAKILNTDRVKA